MIRALADQSIETRRARLVCHLDLRFVDVLVVGLVVFFVRALIYDLCPVVDLRSVALVSMTDLLELVSIHLTCHELKKPGYDLLCTFARNMNMLSDSVVLRFSERYGLYYEYQAGEVGARASMGSWSACEHWSPGRFVNMS